jgi:hypothetical protein
MLASVEAADPYSTKSSRRYEGPLGRNELMKRVIAAATCAAAALIGGIALAQIRPPVAELRQVQTQGILIGLRPATQATAAQRPQVQLLQAQRGAGEINIARLENQRLRNATAGQVVQFQVAPTRTISARAIGVETSGGATIWRGEVAAESDRPPGIATIVMTSAGATGTIHSADGRTYRLRPLAGGETAIIELNYQTMPLDHPPQTGGSGGQAQLRTPALRAEGAVSPTDNRAANVARIPTAPVQSPGIIMPTEDQGRETALNDTTISARLAANPALLRYATTASSVSLIERYRLRPDIIRLLFPPTIDVLVAYTPSAQTASGDINGLITLAMSETNGSFTNSNVWANVRLAGSMAVSYSETGRSYDTIISHFASNGDGFMDNVHTQRDAVHADLVVLIINQSDWCGQAREIGANASQAFVIVHWDCATGYYSFGHEIGHLAGARHDEPTDTTDTPYAYGHGFRHQAAPPNGWRTIMGYRCGSDLCNPRLQYWSSPLNVWAGSAMGVAADADNRRVWNERAPVLAAFR